MCVQVEASRIRSVYLNRVEEGGGREERQHSASAVGPWCVAFLSLLVLKIDLRCSILCRS